MYWEIVCHLGLRAVRGLGSCGSQCGQLHVCTCTACVCVQPASPLSQTLLPAQDSTWGKAIGLGPELVSLQFCMHAGGGEGLAGVASY